MPTVAYINKRFRRDTLNIIHQANAIIDEYQAAGFSLTLRQLFYQFVSRDLLPNNPHSYTQLGTIVSDARLAGLIDWEAIEDRTRNLRKQAHWRNAGQILRGCAEQFMLDRWADQLNYVEVWIEKDALIGVIEGVCREFDVPHFSCRGYTSQSEMWVAAQRFIEHENNGGQNCVLIHLGDHDPSGIDMTRDIEDRLTLFEANVEIHRIALNFDQIERYNPPPNPAKLTDTRANKYVKRFGDESWELDALDPKTLSNLVRATIETYIDEDAWTDTMTREKEIKERLAVLAADN